MQRPRPESWWIWPVVVAAPLLILGVSLIWKPWHPVLDLAMTELRVRDVGGRHTPLIGLPGRIGVFPDQGSHPGPWSFYLLAPWYRLVGGAANGLRLGSVIINSAAVVLTVMLVRRIAGPVAAGAMAVVLALAIRGYGPDVLGQPWNPYFPVMLWILVLVATWGVLAGHARLIPIVVAGATIAAQTHLPYVVISVTAVAVAGYAVVQHARHSPLTRRHWLNWAGIGLVTAVVMWLPPLLDQLRHRPGNLTMLYREFFGSSAEAPIGFGSAAAIWLRHLDVPAVTVDLLTDRAAFVSRSGLESGGIVGTIGAIVTVLGWMAAAGWCWRHRQHPGVGRWWLLHALLIVVVVAELLAISRIHGKPWYYLTLWAWGTTMMIAFASAATAVLVVRDRGPVHAARVRRLTPAASAVVVGVFGVVSTVAALGNRPPESYLSDGLAAVVPDTAAAIGRVEGLSVGPDGRYVIFWQDAANNGSQGYGLLDDLERAGFTVGVHPTWRVPVTPQRVMPDGTYDAEVHLVTGSFIDEWRQRDGYVEVVYADERSEAERRRFDELHADVVARLQAVGRNDLVPTVDTNLFGASLDPDLPRDIVDDLSEMLLIPPPLAVFLAPAGSTS